MAEISTNKRRRKEGLHLSVLPDNAVAHVATYLSNVSRAIFAIASPSASKLTILSDTKLWETLDFGGIDKSLAGKLTDDNIRDVLANTDAVNNIKCLKLTGCVNINGSGLSPLSNSVVLKQLDIGIVGQNESPELDPEPLISEEAVVPILTSIINAHNNKMTHLQLPHKWRSTGEHTQLTDFLRRYNEVLASRGITCIKCKTLVSETSDFDCHVYREPTWAWYGQQNNICYKCLRSFCNGCLLGYCSICEKDFCADCSSITRCSKCSFGFCNGCDSDMKTCVGCNVGIYCGGCIQYTKCACSFQIEKGYCGGCIPHTYICKHEDCDVVVCRVCEQGHTHRPN